MEQNIDIAIFAYNRPDHTRVTLEHLMNNIGIEHANLYIFIDGPKRKDENSKKEMVKKTIIEVLRKYHFQKYKIFENEKNKGLANSIIDGVNFLFNEENKEFLVVLEDDLVTSKYFLNYMKQSNKMYRDNKSIWSISAFNPIEDQILKLMTIDEVFLTKRASSWGWGTWKDRWESNIWEIEYLSELILKSKEKRKEFSIVSPDLPNMLKDQRENRIDSWAIRWVANQFIQNKFTVYPKYSLINNIGFDSEGTHTTRSSYKNKLLIEKEIKVSNNVFFNEKLAEIFSNHYKYDFIQFLSRIFIAIGLHNFVILVKKYRRTI